MNKKNLLSIILLSTLLSACSGNRPTNIGINNGQLAQCPDSPNCVSSDENSEDHYIQPLQLSENGSVTFQRLRIYLQEQDNISLITNNENYIHAEASSDLFGFVDDVEFNYRPQTNIIAVRSASRLGYSDMGVNRKRVEAIRTLLIE